MSLLHRTTIFGACLTATITMSIALVCAQPGNYSFELVRISPGGSIVTVRLKNNALGQLVSHALIDCTAYLGPQGVTTMTEPMIVHPNLTPGEYVVTAEPGMQVFDLDLFAQVLGESQLVTGKIHVRDQSGQ